MLLPTPQFITLEHLIVYKYKLCVLYCINIMGYVAYVNSLSWSAVQNTGPPPSVVTAYCLCENWSLTEWMGLNENGLGAVLAVSFFQCPIT